ESTALLVASRPSSRLLPDSCPPRPPGPLQSLGYGPSSVPDLPVCPAIVWNRSHRHPEDLPGPEPGDLYPLGLEVLEDSRTVLTAAGVLPDGPFPQDEKLKDAFSQVVENTAFFGDVVLRFPRIVHHYFDHNSNWNLLIRWGISFCNQSGVFDQGPHSPILGLMAQELGISEKHSDFQNPFKVDRTEFISSTDPFQKALREEEKRRKKEEKRKEIRKGPRISRSQSEL
uniref:Coiled-coil domain containing 134 n=1 Tax=Bos taurus TaxID=9913 RepID=A0AAA9TMD3_BOVIN